MIDSTRSEPMKRYVIYVLLPALCAVLSIEGAPLAGTPVIVESGARIQAAIDAAEPREIIAITEGIYRENLTISRSVTLLGGAGVRLIPEDVTQPAISISGTDGVMIYGFQIGQAAIGIDISRSSCTVAHCSVTSSKEGICVRAFDGDAVTVHDTLFRSGREGAGAGVVGDGSVLFLRCRFEELVTGLVIGGAGTTMMQDCIVEYCYEAVVASRTATVALTGCTLSGLDANAIRLDPVPFPAAEGALIAINNVIEDVDGFGITLCGLQGIVPDAPCGLVAGLGNAFARIGRSVVCPEELLLPEGFTAD